MCPCRGNWGRTRRERTGPPQVGHNAERGRYGRVQARQDKQTDRWINGYSEHDKGAYFGRMSKEKGFRLVAEVFKEIAREVPGVSLVIVGDGPYRPEMEAALELRLRSSPAIWKARSLRLCTFPATCSSFPALPTRSATSSWKPSVRAPGNRHRLGGPQENLIHSKTGLVVKGDDAGELLHAILNWQATSRSAGRWARRPGSYLPGALLRQGLPGGLGNLLDSPGRFPSSGAIARAGFFLRGPSLFADRERPSAA